MTLPNTNISLGLKLLRLKYRIGKIWAEVTGTEKNVYVWDHMPFYKEMWQSAASELSAQFLELTEGIWEIRYGNCMTRINIHKVQLDDPVILSLAGHKPLCYALMKENELPVPKHVVFGLNELDKAKNFMKENGGLFVIKPAINSSAGMGVTTHIKSYRECRQAIALASLYSDKIIIERFIPGEAYRILVLNGEFIHASRRRGQRVKGDGRSTIKQLIEHGNKCGRELKGRDSLKPINPDRDCKATLRAQGLSSDSILEAGREVLVKSSDNPFDKNVEVRTVYNEDATNLICKNICDQATRVARIFNSQFAGVDIITVDPTVPLKHSGGIINEINTTPGLQHHYNLVNSGDAVSPAVHVLKHLLKINSE